MPTHTTSELAALVHDLCGVLEQHPVDTPEVREATQAVLQALLPMSARETVSPDDAPAGDWGSVAPGGPATWAGDAPPGDGTWAPDAPEAPGSLEAPDTIWEQGPGLEAPTPAPNQTTRPVDLGVWCERILAGEVTATQARGALLRWRPAEGTADKAGR